MSARARANEPRRDVLEHNLARLLRTSYAPARPDERFVARLERRLAPWIAPAVARRGPRRVPWPAVLGGLVAAAALLLALLPRWGEVAPPSPGARDLLAQAEAGAGARTGDGAGAEGQGVARGGDDAARSRVGDDAALGMAGDDKALGRAGEADGELDGATPGPARGHEDERVPAGTAPEALVSSDDAATASAREGSAPQLARLSGRIALPDSAQPPGELRVTLLRAVPLPAVAWPESRRFDLEPGARSFTWDELEPGTYLVQVGADGLAPSTLRDVVLAPGVDLALDFDLRPGARVTGHVVDAETGVPLAGALVIAESDAPVQILGTDPPEIPAEVRARAWTGADGGFELADLSPGAQRLRASHPERAPRWIEVDGLRPDAERAGVLLELNRGGAVEGRVEDAGGTPRKGARIIASHASGGEGTGLMTYAGALTDAEGRYSIPLLAPGTYVVLDLGEDDDTPSTDVRPRFLFTAVVEGRTARVDFLAPADRPTLMGKLVDAAGEPLSRGVAQIVPRRPDGRWAGEETMRSTALQPDGTFAFPGLEPGPYALYGGSADASVLLDVVELPATGRVERTWKLGDHSLAGRVGAEDGEPVGRVTLILRRRDVSRASDLGADDARDLVAAKAWTGPGGAFRIDHLAAGTYLLLAIEETPGRAFAVRDALEVPAPGPLELSLAVAGTLEVELRDAAGEPLAGCALELTDPRGAPLAELVEARTDADGRARFTRLEPGRWTVVAVHGARRSAPLRIDVAPAAVHQGRIDLPAD